MYKRQVVTAPWTTFKCQFGCENFGKNHCCPPEAPDYTRTRAVLDSFSTGILFRVHHWNATAMAAEGARRLFLDGYYKALAFGSGPCKLCPSCAPEGCRFPWKAVPAMEACDGLLFLCPNYNDAVSANITALFNRLTSLLTQRDLSDKYLFGIVVSGYSGSDLVAQQLMGAMCFNKTAMLPPRFCLMQTANDPDSVRSMPGIQERIQEFAAHIEATLLGT